MPFACPARRLFHHAPKCSLHRTQPLFHRLGKKEIAETNIDSHVGWGFVSGDTWSDLLGKHRVVLLLAAETSKTWKIQERCKELSKDGKGAFFLRLEELAKDWDMAFELGDPEELNAVFKNGGEYWLFLDSVDEAHLSDPKDFERALKRLQAKIYDNLQGAHILLTSRVGAWRPNDDARFLRSSCYIQ